ncbi:cell surface spherulin 4-like protein, putative [Talaromyces stipitatus ATCC 10500]|uniref:Cell surface spherulin 4-like protein, putative n=1 Tax=Talaromyces stipitatus (strain ATCC 10500 / CBS 375.48 / QM 6759 / NRRL 1006) TaxID=441959 RepID=B8MHZ7_TALSN|nr:cell surface spherulin 4-like protein, putative [Talaromyces stipitatus ATCC 10500]EED17159.1 cell surface spherulin 4-like protein, putative [Talaromyces stipitatus ATCC 10500]
MKTTILSAACLVPFSAATDVLLPLYVYPLSGAWDAVYNAASAYPDVTFNVIVNPDSGPGAGQYPDSTTIPAINKLNSYPNVQTLGYVHTSYASQSVSKVESNVSVYAGWASYSESNIAVKGIFFDEAPNNDDPTSTDYMSNAASYARGLGLDCIIFNPGALTTATAYYDAADLIVNEEIAYSSYSKSSTVDVIPSQYRNQSAIILHDTPSGADISSLVSTIVGAGIAAFYATEDCCYNSITTSLLDSISSSLENA